MKEQQPKEQQLIETRGFGTAHILVGWAALPPARRRPTSALRGPAPTTAAGSGILPVEPARRPAVCRSP
jgi:hypothetical protein